MNGHNISTLDKRAAIVFFPTSQRTVLQACWYPDYCSAKLRQNWSLSSSPRLSQPYSPLSVFSSDLHSSGLCSRDCGPWGGAGVWWCLSWNPWDHTKERQALEVTSQTAMWTWQVPWNLSKMTALTPGRSSLSPTCQIPYVPITKT